jgi:hypothetical protein
MTKISNKELNRLSKEYYKLEPIIQEIPDSLNRKIIRESLIKMFEVGFRYGEQSRLNHGTTSKI